MKDKIFSYISKYESFLLKWLFENRHRLFGIFTFFVIIKFLSILPFINLFLTNELIVFVTFVVALIALRFDSRILIILAIIIILISIPFAVLGDFERAESMINIMYNIFIAIILVNLFKKDDT